MLARVEECCHSIDKQVFNDFLYCIATSYEKGEPKTRKWYKFWKRENETKVYEFKYEETDDEVETETTTCRSIFSAMLSKLNVFKRERKTRVKPFKPPKSKHGDSDRQESEGGDDGGEKTTNWYKVKLSNGAVAMMPPLPRDIYKR